MNQVKLIIIFSLILAYSNVNAISGKKIIRLSEEAVRGDSQKTLYDITIKTPRWKRTMGVKGWEIRKQKKSFSEVISPKRDAGNRFLLINKTMWHYDPKLQQGIKISPSMMLQSWMGSDFSNDDIVKESSIYEDYKHNLLGKETIKGHECYKVELKPLPHAAVVWGKIIYYARVSDYLPVKKMHYSERGQLKKVLTFGGFKKMDGRTIPTLYLMQTVGKKNQYTLMRIKRIKFNLKISQRTFSLQNLKRRS